MKLSHTCPKCKGSRLLHLSQVADRVGMEGDELHEGLRRGLLGGPTKAWRVARVPNTDQARWSTATAGLIEAYICEGCGYTEFYTRDPDSIPVDGDIVEGIEGPGGGPYRK